MSIQNHGSSGSKSAVLEQRSQCYPGLDMSGRGAGPSRVLKATGAYVPSLFYSECADADCIITLKEVHKVLHVIFSPMGPPGGLIGPWLPKKKKFRQL